MMKIMDGKARLEYSQELLDMLQPGNVVEFFYNEGNINNQIRHIRAIIDDEYVVYRVRSRKNRSGWYYYVSWMYDFQLRLDSGSLSVVLERE